MAARIAAVLVKCVFQLLLYRLERDFPGSVCVLGKPADQPEAGALQHLQSRGSVAAAGYPDPAAAVITVSCEDFHHAVFLLFK